MLTSDLVNIQVSDEVTSLIRISLEALVNAAGVFPSVIKTDLYACIFHIFASKSHYTFISVIGSSKDLSSNSHTRYTHLPANRRASISSHIQKLHPIHYQCHIIIRPCRRQYFNHHRHSIPHLPQTIPTNPQQRSETRNIPKSDVCQKHTTRIHHPRNYGLDTLPSR